MTETEATHLLSSIGFEIIANPPKQNPEQRHAFWLRGENVGWTYDEVLFLRTHLPSLHSPEKDRVFDLFHFSDMDECSKIGESAQRLLDEASRYDEIVRNRRVSEVRQYFKQKREDNEIEKKWSIFL